MGFLGKFKEMLRDKTGDKVCARLCTIGVDARIAERGRPEENIGFDAWVWGKGEEPLRSKALIEIRGSPIRWVNVVEIGKPSGFPDTHSRSVVSRWVYVVPDPHVSTKGGYMLAKSVRVRSTPLIGRVSDIRWEGGKSHSNLIRRISDDVLLNQSLTRLKEDITLCSFPEYSCWSILSTHPPSRENWNCYQAIARHLLSAPL